MGKQFWHDWQLWEKMCFVLGCGIFIVIIMGITRLVINHWRLRTYKKMVAEKISIRREMREAFNARRSAGKDVPFGIRALEKGVEVEGVWISGANTPAHSGLESAAISVRHLSNAGSEDDATAPRDSINDPRGSTHEGDSPRGSVDLPKRLSKARRKSPTGSRRESTRRSYQPRASSALRFSNSHEHDEHGEHSMEVIRGSPHPQKRHSSIRDENEHDSFAFTEQQANEIYANPIFSRSRTGSQNFSLPSRVSHASRADDNPFLDQRANRSSLDSPMSLPPLDGLVPMEAQQNPKAYHDHLFNRAQMSYNDGHAHPLSRSEVRSPEPAEVQGPEPEEDHDGPKPEEFPEVPKRTSRQGDKAPEVPQRSVERKEDTNLDRSPTLPQVELRPEESGVAH